MPPRHTLRRALAAATALSVTVFGLVLSTPAMAAECESSIDAFTASPADAITVATGGSATTVIDVAVTDCVETHPGITVEAVNVATGIGTAVTTAPVAAPGTYQGAIAWSDAQAGAYKLALSVSGHHSDGSRSLLTTSLDYTVTVDPPEPEVTPPSAPRNLAVSNTTRTGGKVSWQAPAETGGAEITGYRIITPAGEDTVAASVRSYTVTGLEPGQAYTIKVQAQSVEGDGPTASVTLKTKPAPPSAPRSLKVSSLTRTSGQVSWTTPSKTGGATITGYQIIKPGTDVTVKATVCSYTVTKLKPGTAYTIRVRAKNAEGFGPAASVTLKTKPLTKPSAPRSLKVSKLTRTSGKVSWTAPAGNGGTKITGYRIVKPGKDVSVKAKARSYTVTKLKAGTVYTIKVQAKNAKGYGPAAAIKFKTKPPAPPKPKHYPNCAALQKVYPHGVGRSGAQDSASDPVTNFYVSTKLYNANNGPRNAETGEYDLDRDNDGVACEKK